MTSEDTGRDGERGERDGDRAVAPPETSGHAVLAGADTQAAQADDAAPDDPEVEGHLLSNPYLLGSPGEGYREQMLADISYERTAAPAPADRGLAKRLLGKVRRRDTG